MSSIEFEEPQLTLRTIDISGAVTHHTPLLIKYGIVKDLATANIIMWVVVFVLITSSILIYTFRPSANRVKYREDYSPEELRHMLPYTVDNLPSKSK